MGQIQMAYPSKLVTRQVTPTPAVQQTATGPAPVANDYRKPVDNAGMIQALNDLKSQGRGFFGMVGTGKMQGLVAEQLRKNGYQA